MLSMSDVPIEQFIPYFAELEVPVAFLVPTPTGMKKSIMDATAPVRDLLRDAGIHDYGLQGQGPDNKVLIPSHFVDIYDLIDCEASLYRPVTKHGDPRIWFSKLNSYCNPCNLLALVTINKEIYVFNLSKPEIAASLEYGGFVKSVLEKAAYKEENVSEELLGKLRKIHRQGFIKSITPGDPGVGDTLEHALGIDRNNYQKPDYKGIELKTTRLTRNGSMRAKTRSTLFAKVPDEGMTYREIVEHYGKLQTPRGSTIARLQLYETLLCSRANAYGLTLKVDENADKLDMYHVEGASKSYVSAWELQGLKQTLLTKHPETFWIQAESQNRDGIEYFRYDKVLHTKNPNTSLMAPLLETDKITIDLAAHVSEDGKWRDHGMLFKMMPENIPLLLGEPTEYTL